VIPTPTVQWAAIAPELILFGAACVLLLAGSFVVGRRARLLSASLALVAMAAAAVASALLWNDATPLAFSGQLRTDRFAELVRIIVCCVGAGAVAMSFSTRERDERISEYYALLCTATAGMTLLAAANGFVTLFVSLELFSISLYVLCAIDVDSPSSLEAGLKYLIIGSVGSSFLVFGAALIYGATTSLEFDRIAHLIAAGGIQREALLVFGIGMVLAGLAFKASVAPFHMWTPDVYEGAPTGVTAFMGAATKAVAFAILFRVLTTALAPSSAEWQDVVAALAVASMAIGNLAALAQRNAKRMLAYSSIGQAGYLLIPVVAGTALAGRALLFYLVVYSATTVGAFAVVLVREQEIGRPVELDDLRGWGYARPALGAGLALFLLSLASFPPTGGFIAKFFVFSSAIDAGWTWLTLVGIVATVVSLGYYLRFAVALYASPAPAAVRRPLWPESGFTLAAVVAAAAVVIWLGVAPHPMLVWARQAAESLTL
jgi:NADH-quinone oxidoreductase subunit N